jgi:hypothetical protein
VQTLFGTGTGKLLRSQHLSCDVESQVPLHECLILRYPSLRRTSKRTVRGGQGSDTYPDPIITCLTLKLQKAQTLTVTTIELLRTRTRCHSPLQEKKIQASQTVLPSPQISLVTSLGAKSVLLSGSEEPLCSEHIAVFSNIFNCLLGLFLNWKTKNLVGCSASGPIIRVKEPSDRPWRLHLNSRVALGLDNVENAFQNSEASIRSSVYERLRSAATSKSPGLEAQKGTHGTLPELLQRVVLFLPASPTAAAEFASSPTSTPLDLVIRKWNKSGPFSFLFTGGR